MTSRHKDRLIKDLDMKDPAHLPVAPAPMPDTRHCDTCDQDKPRDEFTRDIYNCDQCHENAE